MQVAQVGSKIKKKNIFPFFCLKSNANPPGEVKFSGKKKLNLNHPGK